MPIRINLLAEDQAAEEMRRRDPVKRSIWVGGFLVFLVLLWGLTIFLKTIIAKAELANSEGRWKSMERTAKQVDADRKHITEVEKKLAALTEFTANRFLWANGLDALQQAVLENIYLIRVKVEQSYGAGDGAKSPPGAVVSVTKSGGGGAVEKIILRLEGRDYSLRAAEQVPHYKEALATTPFFQANLQKTNSVMLMSLSAPQADKKGPFVVFGLQLNFQEKERRLHE